MKDGLNINSSVWKEFINDLVARCCLDDNFRQEFIKAPKKIMEQEMTKIEEGARLPKKLKVKIIEEDTDTLYIILPKILGLEI